jgi:tight adherence protein C
MLRIARFLIFGIFIFSSIVAHAQKLKCGKKYELIDSRCIVQQAQSKKLKAIKFVVPKDPKKLIDKTYFFKTEFGSYGKFKVISALSDRKECTLYLEATTYVKGQSYNPAATFAIKNEYNIWDTDRAGFDKVGSNDFILAREKGKCVFSSNRAQGFYYGSTKEEGLLTGRETLYDAALFLIGLAVFLVARSIFADEEKFKAAETLDDAEEEDKKAPSPDMILRYSRPFFKRYFSPIVAGMKNKRKIKDKYKRKLATSGLTKELTPEDFFAFKLFLIIGFPILFIIIREFLEETWPMTAIPGLAVVGFFYPDIWINGKIELRKEDITKNMPFIVDMLALSVEAGLDFVAAMTKVIEKAPPSALTEEFEIMLKETKVGASRAEGLRQLGWRCDTIQVSSFCATLIAADSVGANIGPILKTLAAEMRQKRSADAEKKGATAATKILFPMMFLIMPSVAIIIMAPIMLQMMLGA